MAFLILSPYKWENFSLIEIKKILLALFYSAIIISVWICAKKVSAYNRDIEIKHSIWKFQRYSIEKSGHLKKPFPIGVILPLILSVISLGFIKCFSLLQFDAKALVSKVAKRYGRYRFSEILETDLAMISFWGVVAVLALSLIADFSQLAELSKYSLYFVIWNLIPISQLDGIKIWFGSKPLDSQSIFLFSPLYIISLIITAITTMIIFL